MRSRHLACTAAAIAAALTVLAGAAAAQTVGRASGAFPARVAFADALVERLNALRENRGLRPLALSDPLATAASEQARSMGQTGWFAHVSADGSSFAGRIARHYPRRGTRAWTVGENLCFGDLTITAAQCIELWLASPPHRRNLFDPAWREVGVVAIGVEDAPGDFGRLDTTIVVADFGARG